MTTGAVALGAAGLTACASGSPTSTRTSTSGGGRATGAKAGFGSGTPTRGGSASVGIIADIDGFYPPASHWDINGYLYANTIYDPLMAVAADGSIRPYLAESMTSNAAFTEWTMKLRPGITFSDGSDLTAAVVKSNFEVLSASLLTGQALKGIQGLDIPDDLTVVYTLSDSRPRFPAGLTTQVGYVVGQAMIDQAATSNTPAPVGTGPFVYQSWQPNGHFTATRNSHYWRRGLPYLDQITFRPIPDDTQRAATLKTGGVDLMVTTDPVSIKEFTDPSSFQLVDSLSGVVGEPSVGFIMLNTEKAPTNDLRIRQALAKALDVTQILAIFGGGYTKPINGLFLPGSEYYSDTGYPGHDPAGAKSLVEQYTSEHGPPDVQLTTVPDPWLEEVVQVVQQMWSQAGVNVTVNSAQQAGLITDFVEGNFQAATSYLFGAVDPDLNYVWLSTTTVEPVGSVALNFPRNADPEIERALLAGRHSTNRSERIAAYQKLNQRLAVDLPYLWLEQYPFAAVGDARLQNFVGFTLPDGTKGYGFDEGVMFPTQMWLQG